MDTNTLSNDIISLKTYFESIFDSYDGKKKKLKEHNKQIISLLDELNEQSFFENLADSEIEGKEFNTTNSAYQDFLFAIYNYIITQDHIDAFDDLLENNKFKISKLIKDISFLTVPFLGKIFPKVTAHLVQKKYSSLLAIKTSGFAEKYDKLVLSFGVSETSSFEIVLSHFNETKYLYKEVIDNVCRRSINEHLGIPAFLRLENKYKEIQLKRDNSAEYVSNISRDLRILKSNYADNLAKNDLKDIDLDELRQYKQGIRVKTFKDNGYRTYYSIYTNSVDTLAQISGISYSQAEKAKNIVYSCYSGFVQAYKRNPQLSRFSRSIYSERIVTSLYNLIRYKEIHETSRAFLVQFNCENNIKKLETVNNGLVWFFYSDNKKQELLKEYSLCADVLVNKFSFSQAIINRLEKEISQSTQSNVVWASYENNTRIYNNLLNDI